MLSAYGTDKGCLTGFPTITDVVPEGVVWIDMVEPTFDEEKVVEASLKIDIPTREELAEIEASSRLYQEDGAAFMTANLIRRGENDRPESSPVTFIIESRLHHIDPDYALRHHIGQCGKFGKTALVSAIGRKHFVTLDSTSKPPCPIKSKGSIFGDGCLFQLQQPLSWRPSGRRSCTA